MNLRDKILATQTYKREYRSVHVPQWPGTEGKLFLRSLNAMEYEQYAAIITRPHDPKVCTAAEVAVLVLSYEDGSPVFRPDDAKSLGEQDTEPLDTILDAFSRWRREQADARKKSNGPPTGETGTT